MKTWIMTIPSPRDIPKNDGSYTKSSPWVEITWKRSPSGTPSAETSARWTAFEMASLRSAGTSCLSDIRTSGMRGPPGDISGRPRLCCRTDGLGVRLPHGPHLLLGRPMRAAVSGQLVLPAEAAGFDFRERPAADPVALSGCRGGSRPRPGRRRTGWSLPSPARAKSSATPRSSGRRT